MERAIPAWKSGLRAGILGGGQLARMLCKSAAALGLKPVVYCENESASAAQASPYRCFGSLTDEKALSQFFQSIDFAVFENEFVDGAILNRCRGNVPIYPSVTALEQLRDKLSQKKLFESLGLSTARFIAYENSPVERWVDKRWPVKRWMDQCQSILGADLVFKWGRLGYDGKGILMDDPDSSQLFCQRAIDAGVTLYAEKRVRFERELAVVAVRSTVGEIKSYPLVVSEQKDGVCRKVFGPAEQFGVPAFLNERAHQMAEEVARETGLVGTFAIELFESNGEMWINEMAPRVHNAGHFSQDAGMTNQFENHWRAVLGLPLGSTRASGVFAMINLLGPKGVSAYSDLPIPGTGMHLHWYGKEVHPGRKVGHLNGWADNPEELFRLMTKMENCVSEWESRIQKGKMA